MLDRIRRAFRHRPLPSALAAIAFLVTIWVVFWPLAVTRYPPMTDLPFHAAETSTLRHYFDPSWHLREQFVIQPFVVPYLSMYVVGALLMLALPAILSVKIAAGLMLALLPAGMCVMFDGMKKSPLLGLTGLGLVWCNLTHWGFLNFVGALGLFVMIVGLTLRLVDRPSARRQIALALALVALFFTHVFRFPFAVAAVLGTAVVMAPATRRFRPVILPLVPSLALFGTWMRLRKEPLGQSLGPIQLHRERLSELPGLLFGGLTDPAEPRMVALGAKVLCFVVVVSVAAILVERRIATRSAREWAWAIGVTVVPLACAGVFLALFLSLPMQMGAWWYVYPREATAAVFVALGALPDLPRSPWVRAAMVGALSAAALEMGAVVAKNYALFDRATEDFHAISQLIPQAPKLMYLVFDHGGSTRSTTPFIHLPAYVQAERGGWLGFHFAAWGWSPIAYRSASDPNAVVPPPVPLRWEWTPQLFAVRRHGRFFDWFLVRQRTAPDALFAPDPTIERVEHIGTWWLYRRRPETTAP